MKQYRNIGTLNNDIPPNIEIEERRSQVYLATHDEEGKRLPHRSRSFISFSYGGRNIEDFNLLATIQSNRIQREAYAEFEDNTTTYDVVDGQFYWGTHFTKNQINFSLSTDGITEDELGDFKNWFQPGKIRKLILAENPNRYADARVAAPPSLSLLPFEKIETRKIAGTDYEYSTTLYRGEISLSFIMDDPFWHSRNSIIDYFYTNKEDKFYPNDLSSNGPKNMNSEGGEGNFATIEDKDFLKVIFEDRVPYIGMFNLSDIQSIVFANNVCLANNNARVGDLNEPVDTQVNSQVAASDATDSFTRVGVILAQGEGGKTINLITGNVDQYLFYGGTAPASTRLQFTLTPRLDDNSNLICAPLNSDIVKASEQYEESSNYLKIGERAFRFTIPSIWKGYNQAITLIKNFNNGEAIEEVEDALRDGVNEYYVRAWAMHSLEEAANNSETINNTIKDNFIENMKKFLTDDSTNESQLFSATFSFDSKTGEAIGQFTVRVHTTNGEKNNDDYTFAIEENVGDMVRSEYLFIDERCEYDDEGQIPITNCLPITTNYSELSNVIISFKNEYL